MGKAEGEGQGGFYIQNPDIDGKQAFPSKEGPILAFRGLKAGRRKCGRKLALVPVS